MHGVTLYVNLTSFLYKRDDGTYGMSDIKYTCRFTSNSNLHVYETLKPPTRKRLESMYFVREKII